MNSFKWILISGLVALAIFANISSCTHDDDISDIEQDDSLELVAMKTTSAPTIDGAIDAMWEDAQKISFTASVPDPGNSTFAGYAGDSYDIDLKAMYDNNNIYFLMEWNDVTENLNRDTWYFDPADKQWSQESGRPIFDSEGNMIREAFYEDKMSFLFNINNTVDGWENSTCFASCHTSLTPDQGLARHYTNSANERIDMWHWKLVRTNINSQADDQHQNDEFPNGRNSDSKEMGGYTNNVQTLNNGTDDVTVPKYFIPGETDYYWITQDEIDAGTAVLFTAVDANGILSYAGGTIDPNTDTDFQRDGESIGPKGIPSIYTAPFVGNRGDITAKGVHTGSGWVVELQRALKTNDMEGQDVDFSTLEDQPFGAAVFDNAQIAHAIKSGLLLKFE